MLKISFKATWSSRGRMIKTFRYVITLLLLLHYAYIRTKHWFMTTIFIKWCVTFRILYGRSYQDMSRWEGYHEQLFKIGSKIFDFEARALPFWSLVNPNNILCLETRTIARSRVSIHANQFSWAKNRT